MWVNFLSLMLDAVECKLHVFIKTAIKIIFFAALKFNYLWLNIQIKGIFMYNRGSDLKCNLLDVKLRFMCGKIQAIKSRYSVISCG